MLRIPRFLLCVSVSSLVFCSSSSAASQASEGFAGTWEGEIRSPFDPKPMAARFGLEQNEDGTWSGAFDGDMPR